VICSLHGTAALIAASQRERRARGFCVDARRRGWQRSLRDAAIFGTSATLTNRYRTKKLGALIFGILGWMVHPRRRHQVVHLFYVGLQPILARKLSFHDVVFQFFGKRVLGKCFDEASVSIGKIGEERGHLRLLWSRTI